MLSSKLTGFIAVLVLALFAQSTVAAVIARFPTKALQNREPGPEALTNAKRMALGLPLNPPIRRDEANKPPPHPSTTPKPPKPPVKPPPKPPVKPPPPPKPPVKPPPPPKPPVKPPPPPKPPVKPPHP